MGLEKVILTNMDDYKLFHKGRRLTNFKKPKHEF